MYMYRVDGEDGVYSRYTIYEYYIQLPYIDWQLLTTADFRTQNTDVGSKVACFPTSMTVANA